MPPKWLFRAYSNLSQGINTSALFAPKAAVKKPGPRHYRSPDFEDTDKAAELVLALKWKPDSDHFVFFSNSLLLALAVAAYRDSKGESEIHITCIDTNRVRTPFGKRVVFENAEDIFTASNHAGINNSDGSRRDYSDVFVATECVDLGPASWVARYKDLKERGLHDLFPRYAPQTGPRLNIVVQDMRAFGFQCVHSLTANRVDATVRLASAFLSTAGHHSIVPMHLLAALLAFKKTDPTVGALKSWLRQRCQDVILLDDIENEIGADQDEDVAVPPETDLQLQMMETIRNFQVTKMSAASCAPLSHTEVRAEREALERWMQDKHQSRRRERDDNPRKPRKSRKTPDKRDRDRAKQLRSDNEDGGGRNNVNRRAFKAMGYTSGNDGSSLETPILLEDSDGEAEEPVVLSLNSSLRQNVRHQDRYSNDRRHTKRRWRGDGRYIDRMRGEEEGSSRKRRKFAKER